MEEKKEIEIIKLIRPDYVYNVKVPLNLEELKCIKKSLNKLYPGGSLIEKIEENKVFLDKTVNNLKQDKSKYDEYRHLISEAEFIKGEIGKENARNK